MSKKKESKTQWKPTDNRFVAFIDILGFKDLVMRNTHKYIYNLLNDISKIRNFVEKIQDKRDFPDIYKDVEVYTVSFSDSIFIFSKNDTIANFIHFINSASWLIAKAIEESIPLKGAISHGLISVNKSSQIYCGQPIIDAYLLEKEVYYFGIVAHNSIDRYVTEKKFQNKINRLFEATTPLKCGDISHLNLNWFRYIEVNKESDNKEKLVQNKIKSFNVNVSGSPRKYVDNTLQLFNKVITTHEIV
ncbi:MAG: hypothetical protein KAV44_07915 [Bacteroidales bacterium]|nr:hypothetical protein [Bacteroidales bacterium]